MNPSAPTHRLKRTAPPRAPHLTEYIDGYVLPVRTGRLPAFRRLSRLGARVWCENGALSCRSCVGRDLDTRLDGELPRQFHVRRGEVAMLTWVVFESREHRDQVNARVMNDRRMAEILATPDLPFDASRMVYVGFEVDAD